MPRNLSDALIGVLRDVTKGGEDVLARGQQQREIRGHVQTIARPNERVLILPGRANNIFAQIAETAWVMAGRDDMDFLVRYLPRAAEFSDDGRRWRAAYGPRLRSWGGKVDQCAEVVARLQEDPFTKRAAMSIFDPGVDYCDTLDVPCNNWLHFLQRKNQLHTSVAVRANDAIWGFSGINVFEWSVLQELIASSIGADVGEMHWYVGSMHVYDRHYRVAEKILRNPNPLSVYDFGVRPLPITTSIAGLDEVLDTFMRAEARARVGDYTSAAEEIDDPFFSASLTMLNAYNMLLNDCGHGRIIEELAKLPESDLRLAAVEYLTRRTDTDFGRELSLTPRERGFLAHHVRVSSEVSLTTSVA
ncbi:MAG: thymidylate synthase [Nocardioides sp.]|uniref:thymidylate synthase n=1 Tax=Nocardioides sp. TaxID=35761 RepID=UPI003D6BAB1C